MKEVGVVMELKASIKGRSAVRHYDEQFAIPQIEIERLLQLSSQSPSGHNLQSWRVAVVTNQEVREKIKPFAHNQAQIVTASALLVFYANTHSAERTTEIYTQDMVEGFIPEALLQGKIEAADAYHATLSAAHLAENAVIDTSLFAMNFMLLAHEQGYDTIPMRGFSQAAITELIDVPPHYKPTLLMALGKGKKAAHQTSRLSVNRFTRYIE